MSAVKYRVVRVADKGGLVVRVCEGRSPQMRGAAHLRMDVIRGSRGIIHEVRCPAIPDAQVESLTKSLLDIGTGWCEGFMWAASHPGGAADEIVRMRGELAAMEGERDEMRRANITPEGGDRPYGQSVEYWQDRCLDHATALDKARAELHAAKGAADEIKRLTDEVDALTAVARSARDVTREYFGRNTALHSPMVVLAAALASFSDRPDERNQT